jgi:hypothetical protein
MVWTLWERAPVACMVRGSRKARAVYQCPVYFSHSMATLPGFKQRAEQSRNVACAYQEVSKTWHAEMATDQYLCFTLPCLHGRQVKHPAPVRTEPHQDRRRRQPGCGLFGLGVQPEDGEMGGLSFHWPAGRSNEETERGPSSLIAPMTLQISPTKPACSMHSHFVRPACHSLLLLTDIYLLFSCYISLPLA